MWWKERKVSVRWPVMGLMRCTVSRTAFAGILPRTATKPASLRGSGLMIYGSQGVIELPSGFLETAWLLKDSHWSSGPTKSEWQPISSNGLNKPETRTDRGYTGGHPAAVNDLIDAIQTDRQPRCGAKDALAATEMILAVWESHRQNAPVPFPLANRKHPLTLLK